MAAVVQAYKIELGLRRRLRMKSDVLTMAMRKSLPICLADRESPSEIPQEQRNRE